MNIIKFSPGYIHVAFSLLAPCSANKNLTNFWEDIKRGFHSDIVQFRVLNAGFEDRKKYNWTERKIYALVGKNLPFVNAEISDKTAKLQISGYAGEVWQILNTRLQLNAGYIKDAPDRKHLRVGDADLSLIPVVMISEDYDFYDYSQVIGSIWFQLYRKSKGHIDISPFISREVKLSAYVITVAFVTLHWLLIKSRISFGLDSKAFLKKNNKRHFYEMKQTQNVVWESSLVFSCLDVLGLVFQQGPQIRPKCCSGRILSLICTIFGWLVCIAYSAKLITNITTIEKEAKIENLNDLPSDWPHALCMAKSSFTSKAVTKDSRFTTRQAWHNFLNLPPCSVSTLTVPPKDYCKPETIVLAMEYEIASLRESKLINCEIVNDKEKYFPSYLALTLRKGLIQKEFINQYIIKLYEVGVLERIGKSYFFTAIETDEAAILREDYSLSFRQVYIYYYYYFYGVVSSLCVFLLEIFFFYTIPFIRVLNGKRYLKKYI